MTAKVVYGIAIGDSFESDKGDVWTVLEFMHDYKPHTKWKAECSNGDVREVFTIDELKAMDKV